jgi:hypothetical protein
MKRAAALVVVAAVSAGAVFAAQSRFTRTPLQDQPISVAGHHGRNTGSVKTTFVGTYVVESGKPLSAPAK